MEGVLCSQVQQHTCAADVLQRRLFASSFASALSVVAATAGHLLSHFLLANAEHTAVGSYVPGGNVQIKVSPNTYLGVAYYST